VRVTAAYASGGLLETLAVAPIQGLLISQTDDVPGAQVVADISYGTWQTVFAGDPNVAARETYLDGLKCTIIGVMPKGFQFPPGEPEPAQIWTALRLDPANPGNRGGHNYYLLGRLDPGVSGGAAQGGDYRELGADHFDRIDVNRIRRSLVRRLERLGHKVTLEPLAQTA
jgi:putative ABC transport system permease protein